MIAMIALGHQLHALGLAPSTRLEFDSDALKLLEAMYREHGDCIAVQYGGSNTVNTIDSYRPTGAWTGFYSRDKVESARRYYANSFGGACPTLLGTASSRRRREHRELTLPRSLVRRPRQAGGDRPLPRHQARPAAAAVLGVPAAAVALVIPGLVHALAPRRLALVPLARRGRPSSSSYGRCRGCARPERAVEEVLPRRRVADARQAVPVPHPVDAAGASRPRVRLLSSTQLSPSCLEQS